MTWEIVEIIFVVESVGIAVDLFHREEKKMTFLALANGSMEVLFTNKGKAREEQVFVNS